MAKDTASLLNKLMNGRSLIVIKHWIKQHFVEKVTGKGLSTNDFTDEYKEKVDSTEEVATDEEVEQMIHEIFD